MIQNQPKSSSIPTHDSRQHDCNQRQYHPSSLCRSISSTTSPLQVPADTDFVVVQQNTGTKSVAAGHFIPDLPMDQAVIKDACGDITPTLDEDDEQEEMFVDAHQSLGHGEKEWGGPTRGGRLAEPTRFGDWERKGRCTDF